MEDFFLFADDFAFPFFNVNTSSNEIHEVIDVDYIDITDEVETENQKILN